MSTRELQVDVLIFGGGVAGLWTLAHLRKRGYACLLVDSGPLGTGQTIASQGIIHGGVKYALTGEASDASTSIAAMPRIWDECLAGRGEVDLTSCRVLSREQFLWTTPGLMSRIAGFGASRLVRAEGSKLEASDRPEAFTDAPRGVDVYRVPERVLDPRSLLEALSAPGNSGGGVRQTGRLVVQARAEGGGEIRTASFGEGPELCVTFRAAVLAAGAGNAGLLGAFGCEDIGLVQQLRPLHMVIARQVPATIFGHCLGASNLPRVTITTATEPSGERIWYIGGAIAEGEGVARTPEAQIEACKRELAECLGWLDTSRCRFATLRVDRAEGVPSVRTPPRRPDEPSLARKGTTIVGWPTKLAFAPAFAEKVEGMLIEAGLRPATARDAHACAAYEAIPIAAPPWENISWR